MESAQRGEIIEQPMAGEVFERLPEPSSVTGVASERIRMWQQRIIVARKIRDEKLKNLNSLIKFYEGEQWDETTPALQDKSTINLIWAGIKSELPNLYFQNPSPIVNAKRKEFELPAFAMQELLKYYVKYNLGTELKRHVRLCILDAKFVYGCIKASYTPSFSPNPNKGKPIIAGKDQLGIPIFVFDEEGHVRTEGDKILSHELYGAERVSPKEILIDPECRNFISNAGWVGHELVKPLGYLKENKLYKNTERLRKNIELSDIFKDKASEIISATKELYGKEDTEKVRFVEIYDLKNKELIVLPDNENFFIREQPIIINPFSFLKFNETPDEFYPPSDIKQEIPLQKEVNIGRSLMITHARRSARKYAYDEDTFRNVDPVEGVEAMKSPNDMTLVKVSDLEHKPEPIDSVAQDPSIYQNISLSRADFREVSGGTEAQTGFTQRRKTKGEAGYQESHGAVRRGDKQSLVADFIVDTYRNIAKIMQATLTVPQAIKIIGPAGNFWTQIKREDIQGELFYDIEVSELRPQIPEIDRRELGEFILTLSNMLKAVFSSPAGPIVFNLQGTVKELAKSFPSINAENMLNMKVTPEQIIEIMMQKGNENANI